MNILLFQLLTVDSHTPDIEFFFDFSNYFLCVPVKVRLIDCVGYMVEGAAGHVEGGEERQVKTPWLRLINVDFPVLTGPTTPMYISPFVLACMSLYK